MQNNAYIKEIFTSIQGEGPYIGFNQLFIRFSKCNLNCCYCDTDYKTGLKKYTASELAKIVNKTKNIHSVSLTGGEPLTEHLFLLEFLPLVKEKIYLETNGTLYKNLQQIIKYIDIVSMDIKLNSAAGTGNLFEIHEDFIKIALSENKEIFLKAVFDENITDEEINKTAEIAKKYNILLVIQPKMQGEFLKITSEKICGIFNKFNETYNKTRLIPQVHKFINVQ